MVVGDVSEYCAQGSNGNLPMHGDAFRVLAVY